MSTAGGELVKLREVKLHIVCDICGTRKHPRMQAWLTKNHEIMH